MDILRLLLLALLIVTLATTPNGNAVPKATVDTIPTVANPKGKVTPMPTQPAFEPGILLARVSTQADAEQIATLYGITLESVNGSLARFTTDQDILALFDLGQKNNWPALTPNYYRQLYNP